MRENHDLMKEFRFIAKQHTHEQGEISVFQHYHQFNKHRSNYVQTIKTNLKTISNSHNASSFLLLGEYLSYLIAFESDFAQIFEDERKIYVAQALQGSSQSQLAMNLASKLLDRQGDQILNTLKQQINKSFEPNSHNIELLVRIMEAKMNWQTEKKELTLIKSGNDMTKLASDLIDFICEKINMKNELILSCKIRLMIKVLQYLKDDINRSIYEKRLVQFAQNCMTACVLNQQTRSHLFQLLTEALSMFGLFNCQKLCKFISEHLKYSNNLYFLLLMKTFLSKLGKGTKLTKDFMLTILKRLYESLFDKMNLDLKTVYKLKKAMTDIIIKISLFGKFDFSKNISILFSKTTNPNHNIVLVSLVFLYQQKMMSEVSNAISTPIDTFFNEKGQFSVYENLLNFYSSKSINFQEFINNPNPQQNDFLWNLIAIRNTILININGVIQGNKIYGLLKNLLKFVILNVFPEECAQIIELIINKFGELQKTQIQQISFGTIFQQLKEHMKERIISQQMFKLLKKIISSIHKSVALLQLKGTSLFYELVIIMHQNCLGQHLPLPIFDSFTALINFSIPKTISEDSIPEIREIISLLMDILRERPNFFIFNLFLTLINKTISLPGLNEQWLLVQQEIIQLINGNQILQGLANSYHIHMYIISNGKFDKDVVYNSWKILLQTPNIHRIEIGYHIINLFRYFSQCLSGESLESFFLQQIAQTLQFVILLTNMLERKTLIKQIEDILSLKYAYLIYLYETIQRYSQSSSNQPCHQISKISKYVTTICSKMKSQEWIFLCPQSKMHLIKSGWYNDNLLMLLMMPLLMRMDRSNPSRKQDEVIAVVEADFQWMRCVTDNRNEINYYYLKLMHQIYALKKTL